MKKDYTILVKTLENHCKGHIWYIHITYIYHAWKSFHPDNWLPASRSQKRRKSVKNIVKLPKPTQNKRKIAKTATLQFFKVWCVYGVYTCCPIIPLQWIIMCCNMLASSGQKSRLLGFFHEDEKWVLTAVYLRETSSANFLFPFYYWSPEIAVWRTGPRSVPKENWTVCMIRLIDSWWPNAESCVMDRRPKSVV